MNNIKPAGVLPPSAKPADTTDPSWPNLDSDQSKPTHLLTQIAGLLPHGHEDNDQDLIDRLALLLQELAHPELGKNPVRH